MSVLCIGLNPAIDTTISLDELMLGVVNRATSNESHPAGKAFNVATLLSELGLSVAMTGFLGVDNSDAFITCFDKIGIENHCILVQGKTRQNIKLAESSGRMTDVNGVGFVPDDADKARLFEILPDLCQKAEMVVVSGSLPKGFGLEDWQKLLGLVKANNEKLVVDTSGEALKCALEFAPFLIKPNKDELMGAIGEVDIFAKALDGITHVVLSDGEQGVTWRAHQHVLTASTPKVDVKSTVGAGDTLLSGVVFGLLNRDEHKETLLRAVAMAGHAVSVVGVEKPSAERLARLIKEIEITENL